MAERTFRAVVDVLDGDGLASEFAERMRDGMRAAADEIVREHEESLRAGANPLGGPQRPNSPGTSQRKGGRPPLVNTGHLLRGVRVVERRNGVDVVPPRDRVAVLERLHAQGYVTIFAADKTHFTDTVHDEVAGEAGKLDVAAHVKRTRL